MVTGRMHAVPAHLDPVSAEGRRLKNFSLDNFCDDLVNSRLCNDLEWMTSVTVDELFEYYQQDMTTLLYRHAPRYVRKRKQ